MEQLKRSIKEEANAFQQQILNSNLNQHSNSLADQQSDPSTKSYLSQWLDNLVERLISRTLSILHFNNNPSTVSNTFEYHFLMTIIAQQLSASNANGVLPNGGLSPNASSKARSSSTPYNLIKPHGLSNALFNAADYSMTLSLVIAIGLLMLLVNIVVVVVVYAFRRRKTSRSKKEERKQADDASNGKANNPQKQKPRKKPSIDSTNNNLDARNSGGQTSYLPMSGSLANQLTNSLANAYSANQTNQSGPASIYGPASVPHTAYYYNNVTNGDLNCLTASNVNSGQQTSALNALNTLNNGTLRRGGELDFGDYCCSSANEQHLCIYNSSDRTATAGNSLNANNLSAATDLNRCSTNSDTTNSNGQHSTVNCLSQNSQLSGISCQCDNCTIHTLNSNSPLANQLLNNSLVAGQATLLNANLVNLVNSGLCDSNQCNLTVIHEFEERL